MNWIQHHGFDVIVIYWVFSVIVSGMPNRPEANWVYQWFYSSLHFASGSLARLIATKMPNSAIGQSLIGANGK